MYNCVVMEMGYENIKKNKDKPTMENINDLSPEIKDMVSFLQQKNPNDKIDPMIEKLIDIYDLPDSYKEKAINLIRNEGKTPQESYSIVMEEDSDKIDPMGRRRNRLRRKMGLI